MRRGRDYVLQDADTAEVLGVYDNQLRAQDARLRYNRESAPRSARLIVIVDGYSFQALFDGDFLYRWMRLFLPGDPDEAKRAEAKRKKCEALMARQDKMRAGKTYARDARQKSAARKVAEERGDDDGDFN